MNTFERLQKAVELTIAAGYQLDKDAFDFLNLIADVEDPVEVMNKALEKINALKDKPLFIERAFLEELVKKPEPEKNSISLQTAQATFSTTTPFGQAHQILEGKRAFHPLAKEIEADIAIIDNPGAKLSSSGTLSDYLDYFRDRFKRMEKLLRQRMDARSAVSIIDALKAS
ncbi:MAG: hypothetical protein QXW82_06630, partial [Candidatus Bathyarchaeia archaeon]